MGPLSEQAPIMAFALRSNGGESELHIGRIDLEAYDGDIHHYDCDQSSPFWAIKGVLIRVGRATVNVEQRIIFDTTSQFIRGPKSLVQTLYNGVSMEPQFHEELGLFKIPCETKVSIHLRLGEVGPEWMIEDSA